MESYPPCYNYKLIDYDKIIHYVSHRLIIVLTNGLGNKLSTLACGLFFADKHGIKAKDIIVINIRSSHEIDECYELSLFTDIPIYGLAHIDDLLYSKDPNKIIINTTSTAYKYKHNKNKAKLIVWTDFYNIFDYLKYGKHTKYFFQKIYNKIYSYVPKLKIKNGANNYSIGVHVRLGDFLKQNISNNDRYKFLILRPSYYIDKINSIYESFIKESPQKILHVYFFSDNTNNFIEKYILPELQGIVPHVIPSNTISAIDSVIALSQCDFLVLSESTFSVIAMLLKRTIGLEYYPSWRIKKEIGHKYAMTNDDLNLYFK